MRGKYSTPNLPQNNTIAYADFTPDLGSSSFTPTVKLELPEIM